MRISNSIDQLLNAGADSKTDDGSFLSPAGCEPFQVMALRELWVPLCSPPAWFPYLYIYPAGNPHLPKVFWHSKLTKLCTAFQCIGSNHPLLHPPEETTLRRFMSVLPRWSFLCESEAWIFPVKMLWTCPKTWLDYCCSLVWCDSWTLWTGSLSSPLLLRWCLQKEKLQFLPLHHREKGMMHVPSRLSVSFKALMKKLPWNQKTWGMMLKSCSWLLAAKWRKDLKEKVTAELSVHVLHSIGYYYTHVPPQVLMKAVTPLDTSGLFLLLISILLGAVVRPKAIQRKAGWLRKSQLSGVINAWPMGLPLVT